MTFEELHSIPLLSQQDKAFLEFIGRFFLEKRYPAGTILFEPPQLQTNLYIVLAGKVKLSLDSGEPPIFVNTYSAGEFFGEEVIVAPRLSSMRAVCLTPVHVLEISSDDFRAWTHQYPAAAIPLLFKLLESLLEPFSLSNPAVDRILNDPKALEMGRKFSTKRMQA